MDNRGLLRFDIVRDDSECQEALKKPGLYEEYYAATQKKPNSAPDDAERVKGPVGPDTESSSG